MSSLFTWILEADLDARQNLAIIFALLALAGIVGASFSYRGNRSYRYSRAAPGWKNYPRLYWIAYAFRVVLIAGFVAPAFFFALYVFFIEPRGETVVGEGAGESVLPVAIIRLPLSIHLARQLDVVRHDVSMDNWVTRDDFAELALTEINRLWLEAAIQWHVVSVEAAADVPVSVDVLSRELAYSSDGFWKQSSDLTRTLRLFGRSLAHDRDSFHLIILPFLNGKTTGLATPSLGFAFVAAWSDRGKAPRRLKVTAPIPYGPGSIAHTSAHELGHLLGLQHANCSKGCLMGARPGYGFSAGEIEAARRTAGAFTRAQLDFADQGWID